MTQIYKSKNILKDQQEFIRLLDEYEIDIFLLDEIENLLEVKFENLNSILQNLIDKNFLSRIEKGKYCRPTFRNENVIGIKLVKNGAISYWSALNIHGLTEQFPNTFFIQSTHKKNDKVVFGTSYKFIKVSQRKLVGITTLGYGNHQYHITNPVKTIVDCFDLPQYSGGYPELIRALNSVEINQNNLIEYCKAINNTAVIKRIAYLLQIMRRKNVSKFINFAQSKVNNKFNLLDPLGSDEGRFNNIWRLRLNIDDNTLQTIINKTY